MKNKNFDKNFKAEEVKKYLKDKYLLDDSSYYVLNSDEKDSLLQISFYNKLLENFESESDLKIGFFEAIYLGENRASVMNLNNGDLLNVLNISSNEIELNEIIFGVLEPSKEDNFYYEFKTSPYHFDVFQREEIYGIYSEFDVDDDFLVFIDMSVHKKYFKYLMDMVVDIQVEVGDSLLNNYDYYEIERAFSILIVITLSIFDGELKGDIFTTDYNKIFENLCISDMFLLDNEPERLIRILIDIFKKYSLKDKKSNKTVSSLEKTLENIFYFKKIIKDRGINQTSARLVKMVDERLQTSEPEIKGMLTFIDLIHVVNRLDEIELTMTKKQFTSKTIRKLSENSNFFNIEDYERVSQSKIPIIDFLNNFLFTKDFATIVGTDFIKTAKFDSLIRVRVNVLISHILHYLLEGEIIDSYLNLIDNVEILGRVKLLELIKSKSHPIEKLEKDKLLELLVYLSIFTVENENLKLTKLGNILRDYAFMNEENAGKKILNIDNYKRS